MGRERQGERKESGTMERVLPNDLTALTPGRT